MDRGTSAALAVACVLLLVVGSAAAPGVAGRTGGSAPGGPGPVGLATAEIDAAESAAAAQTATGSDVELTQRLGLVPERPGTYEASHRYRLPNHLRVLEVTLPEGATVVSTTGFSHREGRTYEWDGTTDAPRIDYRLPANRSVDRSGPIGGPGRLTFVDVGEWALVSQPQVSHSWGWAQGGPAVGFERSMAAERGVAGDAIAYLGDYEEHTTSAHGQTFRLIVPEPAILEESPEGILTAMANASDRLRVGDRDGAVFAVAAPTPEGLEWGVRGLKPGDADLWVRDFERLDEANNVWLHEYVHTRQAYVTAADARWITEASAVYYAALLTLKDGRIPYAAVRDRLALGEGGFDGSVLARPDTWRRNPNYYVGALVAGELDRRLRLATEGESTLQEVLRRMNAKDGTVTAADLEAILRGTGGSDVAALGERYTTTTQRPTAWDGDTHREAFGAGSLPVRITYALPAGEGALRVDGPYRTRALGAASEVTLVPGERLTLEVLATNFGEGDGEYAAVLRVDDERRASESGRLAAGESTTLTFEYAVEQPGSHVVSIGDASVRVTVRAPATPRVTGLSVDRIVAGGGGSVGGTADDPVEIAAGESIEVAVDVHNGENYPARLDLPITRSGEVVATRTVRLDAASATTVRADLRFAEPGTYVVGVGDAAADIIVVDVRAESRATETTEAGGSSLSAPGFGPIVAGVAILLWAVARRRR